MQHHGCPQLRHRCLFLFPPQAHPPTLAGQLQLAGPLHLREHDFDLARALAKLSECPGEIEVVLSEVERAGELELASERWGMRLRREEEEASMSELRATMMLHRFEGSWKLSIVVLDSEDLTG